MLYYFLTDESTIDVVRNEGNHFTVVCGNLDSDCLLSYEFNKTLKFTNIKPNTTTIFSLGGNDIFSASFIEISAYVNSTQLVWELYNPGNR